MYIISFREESQTQKPFNGYNCYCFIKCIADKYDASSTEQANAALKDKLKEKADKVKDKIADAKKKIEDRLGGSGCDSSEDPSHEVDGGGLGGDDVSDRNNDYQQHCQTCSDN